MSVNAKMTAIADAIRGKTGGTEPLTLDQMATEIAGIQVGGGGDFTNEEMLALLERTGTEFVIPNGATKIGAGAFNGWKSLTTLSIPETVTSVGESAFSGCTQLVLTELPDAVATIGRSAFTSNGGCSHLTRLPQSLKSMDPYVFEYSTNLKITEIPAQVTTIRNYVFRGCTGLTEITFKSTPSVISTNIFTGCDNLKIINVPWGAGEVSGAPWGATNATVNYNYTGG